MCLILVRNPKVDLPFNKVQTAVKNNPDGWGYVIPDRGQMEIRRFYSGKDTDPDEVAKFLEDNKNQKIYLHLRYATAGTKSRENVHPFPVLTKRKHGAQVMVMHNGTYSAYKKSDQEESDTRLFTQEVLTPILHRFSKNCSKKTLLQDPVVAQVLEKFNEGWSRLVLIDPYGNDLKLGEGYQEDGYWTSNNYSFKEDHRKPAVTTSQQPTGSYTGYSTWDSKTNTATYKPWPSTKPAYSPPAVINGHNIAPKETKPPTPTSAEAAPVLKDTDILSTAEAQTFLDAYKMDSWDDFMALSVDDYEELCLDHPELMARCIQDLMFLLYCDRKV